MDLEVIVELPNGELAKETDIDEFKKNVAGQLSEIAEFSSLKFFERTSPPPEGALGVDQLFQFIVENFENIAQLSRSTAIIVQAVNSLTQMFLKRKKESGNKSPQICIKVGSSSIELPANTKEIDEFVSNVRDQHSKREKLADED